MTNTTHTRPKPRWVVPPLEDMALNTPMSVTINLKDDYMDIDVGLHAYAYFMQRYFRPYCYYRCYYEISKSIRLHIHGEIIFEDRQKMVQFYWRIKEWQDRTSFEIDIINDHDIWDKYMIKQQENISCFLDKNFITSEDKTVEPLLPRDQLKHALDY